MTKNTGKGLQCPRSRNEATLNPFTRIHWRASLVPAAAVTPAPIAYINIAAVKKLVVGSQLRPVSRRDVVRSPFCADAGLLSADWPAASCACLPRARVRGFARRLGCVAAARCGSGKVVGYVYFEKRRVLKAGRLTPVDLGAWNNGRGPRAFVCWFRGAPRQ